MNFAKTSRIKKGAVHRNRALTAGRVLSDIKEKKRRFDTRGQVMPGYVAHSMRRLVSGVLVFAFSHATKKASKGRRGLIVT